VSNPLAIATVTEAFSELLRGVTEEQTLDPTFVSAVSPDRVRTNSEKPRTLNLYLYAIAPNLAVENSDLPFRDEAGTMIGKPELAIDLRYLLTAYGAGDDEIDAQHVLGHAMSVVHDTGYIPRELIEAVVNANDSRVALSDLQDEVHVVRVAPERMGDEDMFRLWSAFESKYRISVCYSASVVLIARPKTFRKAPPVLRAGSTSLTIRPPRIDEITPEPAHAGDTLVLRGADLDADEVTVRIDGVNQDPGNVEVEADEIRVELPDALPAGSHVVQVVHAATLEVIDQTRRTFFSRPVPFTLAPRITSDSPIDATHAGGLEVEVEPRVLRSQQAVALIGDAAVQRTIDPDDTDPHHTTLTFPIPESIADGTEAPLRIEVDGVESPLTRDATPGPNFGLPTAPIVRVTA
jgi:hypothetical protein